MSDKNRLLDILSNPVYCDDPLMSALGYLLENDVIPVVRCCRCRFWNEETGWCDIHSHFVDRNGEACHPDESCDWKMFDENYFCADGKPKDEGCDLCTDVETDTMYQMNSTASCFYSENG